jgi:hypothetical protein
MAGVGDESEAVGLDSRDDLDYDKNACGNQRPLENLSRAPMVAMGASVGMRVHLLLF